MSISSISGSSLTTSLLTGVTSDTDPFSRKSSGTSGPSSADGGGRFASAIKSAFASLGISLDDTSSTSSSSSSAAASTSSGSDTSATDPSSSGDAVSAFLQSLFAALHSQSGDAPPPAVDNAASTTSSATAATASSTTASATDATSPQASADVGRAHHHHGGKLEADLKSLISELTSSSASSTDATGATSSTGVTGSTAATTTSTDPALATLEKNFDALLAQGGSSTTSGTSNTDQLTTFLQSLASNLHGAPATGNVVSTTA